jgi:hypothetical protein
VPVRAQAAHRRKGGVRAICAHSKAKTKPNWDCTTLCRPNTGIVERHRLSEYTSLPDPSLQQAALQLRPSRGPHCEFGRSPQPTERETPRG